MRKIVIDIETQNIIRPQSGQTIGDYDISLVGLYDYETNSYSSYLENEFKDLWELLRKAELIIGYNSDHFDIPILNEKCPFDLK
ncbi:MAG: hypothetical protein OXU73_02065, partial [Candidatus Campbellbacteria bacterium]|nr:hypothetical protein [Candidatus Campbellbacteria bacterium]